MQGTDGPAAAIGTVLNEAIDVTHVTTYASSVVTTRNIAHTPGLAAAAAAP